MTDEINTILNAIAATGATESSDPIRAYIASLESEIAALTEQNQGLHSEAQTFQAQTDQLNQRIADANGELARLKAITGDARAAAQSILTSLDSLKSAAQNFLNGTPG